MLRESGLAALDFFDSVNDDYGVEEEGLALESEDNELEVPGVNVQLIEQQLADLHERVNPLSENDDFGIELYERTVHFITNVIDT